MSRILSCVCDLSLGVNFSCWTVYMTLRISMILYKTFLLSIGGLNLNCYLVIIQLLSFFMLVVSRFILSLCFVFLCACFFSLFCLYLSLCLCFLLCYAVNKDLYINSMLMSWIACWRRRYGRCVGGSDGRWSRPHSRSSNSRHRLRLSENQTVNIAFLCSTTIIWWIKVV